MPHGAKQMGVTESRLTFSLKRPPHGNSVLMPVPCYHFTLIQRSWKVTRNITHGGYICIICPLGNVLPQFNREK